MSPKGVENGLTRGSTSAAQDPPSQRTLSFHTGSMTVEGTRAAMGNSETKGSSVEPQQTLPTSVRKSQRIPKPRKFFDTAFSSGVEEPDRTRKKRKTDKTVAGPSDEVISEASPMSRNSSISSSSASTAITSAASCFSDIEGQLVKESRKCDRAGESFQPAQPDEEATRHVKFEDAVLRVTYNNLGNNTDKNVLLTASTNGDAAIPNHHQRDPTSKPQTLKLTWGKKNSQALQAAVPVDSAPHSPSSEPPAVTTTTSGRKSRQRYSSSGKDILPTSPVVDMSSRRRSRSKYNASNLASSTVSNFEDTITVSQNAALDKFLISPAVSSPPLSLDDASASNDSKSARVASMKEVLPTIIQESPLPRRPRKAKTDAISANAALSRPETPQVLVTASTSRESSPVTELSRPVQRKKRNFAEDLSLPLNMNSGARGSHARGNKRAKVMSDDGTTFYEPDVKLRESYRENNPNALPNTYQIGILPLGTMPPPERWDQVFNTDVPKVPEVFLPSDINFLNYWGSTGTDYTKRTSKDEKRTYWKYKHDGRLDDDDIWVEDYELKKIRRDKEKTKPPTTRSITTITATMVSTPSNRETRSRQPSTAASKDATPSVDAEADEDTQAEEVMAQEEQSTNRELGNAWALTGINGALHQYGINKPYGESLPVDGLQVWESDPSAHAEIFRSDSGSGLDGMPKDGFKTDVFGDPGLGGR